MSAGTKDLISSRAALFGSACSSHHSSAAFFVFSMWSGWFRMKVSHLSNAACAVNIIKVASPPALPPLSTLLSSPFINRSNATLREASACSRDTTSVMGTKPASLSCRTSISMCTSRSLRVSESTSTFSAADTACSAALSRRVSSFGTDSEDKEAPISEVAALSGSVLSLCFPPLSLPLPSPSPSLATPKILIALTLSHFFSFSKHPKR
mmetsp:Transcript_46356/g.91630  ORF Transcript_46356/g.91630 Transcript_46356/m.91630 type:complete len:209 (+) Transcript_46356:1124-1750(+)